MGIWTIKSHGDTNGIGNPLKPLDGETYETYDEAVEAVFNSLHEVITGENGVEFVAKSDDAESYADDVREEITRSGHASEDGWDAEIELLGDGILAEIADSIDGIHHIWCVGGLVEVAAYRKLGLGKDPSDVIYRAVSRISTALGVKLVADGDGDGDGWVCELFKIEPIHCH